MAEPLSNINDAGSPVARGEGRLRVAPEATHPPGLPGMPSPDHLLHEGERGSTRLNSAAERVGSAVGNAVGSMRRAKLRVVGGRGRSVDAGEASRGTAQRTRERVSHLADSAGERLTDFKQGTSERFTRLRDRAGQSMSQFASSARVRADQARVRARHFSSEYPLQAILGFGALAFAVGLTLRIWRSNGD